MRPNTPWLVGAIWASPQQGGDSVPTGPRASLLEKRAHVYHLLFFIVNFMPNPLFAADNTLMV